MLSAGIFVTGIYAFSTRTGRRLLWDDLLNLQQECASRPWLVGGDFNCILSAEESAGPVFPDSGSILDFAGFLGQGDFRELPTSGGVFTWSGVRSRGRVWRKLDRLLFNSEWFNIMPPSSVQVLNRATSDHNPLLLSVRGQPSVPKPFKFQSMWLRRSTFPQVVSTCWNRPIEGYGMFKFTTKLRRLKATLKQWNSEIFGNVFHNLSQAETRLKELELYF